MGRKLEVNGRNCCNGIYSQALCVSGKLHAVTGVIAGNVGYNNNPALCHCHDILQHQLALFHTVVYAFTGRAADI